MCLGFLFCVVCCCVVVLCGLLLRVVWGVLVVMLCRYGLWY